MPATRSDLAFAAAAAVLGAWAFYKTQAVSKDMFEPILAACTSPGDSPVDVELIPYEARLGLGLGPFVCMITQFLHKLTERHPSGMITWVLTLVAAFPAVVLMIAESGRSGARGIVRYPTIVGLLGQFFGISVVFPLVWVPGCILFGSKDGAVLPSRMYAGTLLNLPLAALTYFVFAWDTTSYGWRVSAGILGGPILPLTNLFLWKLQPPLANGASAASHRAIELAGASATARAYLVAFAAGLVGWAVVLRAAMTAYGLDVFAAWDGVWTNSDGAVRFMVVDAGVLWLGVLVFMASRSVVDAMSALLMTCALGPGAACSLVLWGRERLKLATAMAVVSEGKKAA